MPKNVKNTTFPSLFNLLAPHTCRGCGRLGDPLCQRCKNNIISQQQNFCPVCNSPNLHGKCQNCQDLPPIFIAGYKSTLIGDLIQAFKYDSLRALSLPLAEILDSTLPQNIIRESPQNIIIPLPTVNHHIRTRGFDHTLLVSRQFAKLHPNTKVQTLLVRQNRTVQVGSNRHTRFTQASNAYQLNSKIPINPKYTYILFDDVWTTGASLQAAYSLLQKSGAKKIIIAALAYSDPQNKSKT